MSLITKIILAGAIVISPSYMTAQSNSSRQMTQAVYDAYERMLKDDPNDYETWFRRANEYYRHNEYMRALNDVDRALELAPEKEKDLRVQAYMLRANIYEQTGRHEQALQDLNSAIALEPTSYVAVYQRANCLYELGQYSEAKAAYQRLQRLNSRSAEALIGLARVAVKENNLGLANEYLETAVNNDPGNSTLYVRRASVRRLMGNDQAAVDDLILAIATDSRNVRATDLLVDMARSNYPEVNLGLTRVIQQAPNVGMYLYMRAFIAQAHYRYGAALADYRTILDKNLYNYHGIYASIAECQFALGQYDSALTSIDQALSMDRNSAQHYIVRSRILRALGQYEEAKQAAASALAIKSDDAEAMQQMALCYISLKNYREAANLVGEAMMNGESAPYNYLLRGWILTQHLNEPVAGKGFYDQLATLMDYDIYDVKSLKGFGLLYSGHKEEAVRWMDDILTHNADPDGYLNYIGACLYSAADLNDRALECVNKSLSNGYANKYDWEKNDDACINVSAIRYDLRFIQLIEKYSSIFQN